MAPTLGGVVQAGRGGADPLGALGGPPARARPSAGAGENVAQVQKWNVGGVRERSGVCARARACPAQPDGVPADPSIARSGSGRGPAAPPPDPARPPAHRPPPRMELSAIGEQVFAVESIRKKRVRKVRLLGGGSRDAARSPPAPQHRPLQVRPSGKGCGVGVGGHLGTRRCLARLAAGSSLFPATR